MFPPAPNTMSVGATLGAPPGADLALPLSTGVAPVQADPYADDLTLLALFDRLKRESMEYRWIWEREWLRDLYYVANRQWITFNPAKREWVDKKLQKWVPRPVTNKMAETVQAIRTNLGAINLSVVARPVGHDTESIAAADVADQMSPLIHAEHEMDQVMREADFWLITTGNACLQISWDKDSRFNRVMVPNEQCTACGAQSTPKDVVDNGNHCPMCQGPFLKPATDPLTGQPAGTYVSFGKGKTSSLSPFEYAFAPNNTRFSELPYMIRLRWRDKLYYEANLPDLVPKISWEKSPQDRSLQIFKSLAMTNDVGTGSTFQSLGTAGSQQGEGVTEYELWLRPTPTYPKGLILRVCGDQQPLIVRNPEEAVPGPIPYTDIEGTPLFPFVHAQYEHMGGRLYGRSAISPLIQKQDQLNQLDSLVQLQIQRTANPAWVIPENAGIENITGEPGLVIKWNVLAAQGHGKPERIPGVPIDSSLFAFREQILHDIEDLSGAFDIIKGQKPTGIEAFSALQLLVERSQSRFTSVFQSRGEMYRAWFGLAIELERQFGPNQRVYAVVGPNRGYTFRHFENAQLQGQVSMQIEDGSNMPKTALGKRAAIEQANQLMLLNPQDPDQKYALLTQFGLSDLVPALNTHVQAAKQIQDAFEKWVDTPQGPSPLVIKPWFDPQVHWIERVKWLNTDKMREIMAKDPQIEMILTQHLQLLQIMLQPPAVPGALPIPGTPPAPGTPGAHGAGPNAHGGPPSGAHAPGGGQAMAQSNKNGGAAPPPGGNAQHGPNVGPA